MSELLGDVQRREVAVEGVRFLVHRAGPTRKRRTTPALLLHGVPQTSGVWRHLLPELRRDRMVIVPDLKGLGGSESAGPYDVATLVQELAALVLHEVDGPVDVLGHDWGGSLALALAGSRPELVRRLAVISAPYRSVDLLHAFHLPLLALPALPEALFAAAGERILRQAFRYAWRSPEPLDEAAIAEYLAAYADPARVQAMLGYYRAMVRPRVWRALGLSRDGAPVPPHVHADRMLVVWGAADPVLPLPVGEAVQRDLGPDARLVTLPGVGHFPLEEAPEEATRVLTDFVRDA